MNKPLSAVQPSCPVSEAILPQDDRAFPIISLFAGAGGMDMGFEKAGFKTIWANDSDKTVIPSYRSFFPHAAFDSRSIRDIPGSEIPKADGVIGGPPCQCWSIAGCRRGIDDPRGQLFYDYIRVVHHVQPLFFVAENVSGLLQRKNRHFFNRLLRMMEEEGYAVTWKLVNAHYYGVPQDRLRVFMVGYHHSLGKRFVFPAPLSFRPTLKNAIFDLRKLKIGKTQKIKNHEISRSHYSSVFMSGNRVRSWDEPSFTILASSHTPIHPQAPRMVPTGQGRRRKFAPGYEHLYRRLTVRECARIQTFPDTCRFLYRSVRNGYKMVGNAVPVELAFHIAKAIKADLEGEQR